MLPRQLLRGRGEDGPASGPRRARLRGAGGFAVTRRYLPLSHRGDQARRGNPHHAPRLRRCRRARRRGASGVPRRRSDHTGHVDPVAGRRADQPDAAAGDAANAGTAIRLNDQKGAPAPSGFDYSSLTGVIHAIVAPPGACMIAIRPTVGTSKGSRMTLAPAAFAALSRASTLSTAR